MLIIRTDLDPSSPPEVYGSAKFEAEVLQEPRSEEDEVRRDPETTLKIVAGMRRENYAVGVFFLSLGLGVAKITTQAVTSLGQKGVHLLGKAASDLDEQQKVSADRAKQWLKGLVKHGEKRAIIAQESLEEWPDVVQQSLEGAMESHIHAVQHAQANVQQWAQTYVAGSADVQRLWQTAAEAAKKSVAQVSQAAGKRTVDGGAQVQQSTPAANSTGTEALGRAAGTPPQNDSTASGSRRRSDAEVYAAESLAAARAAEARWNERIRNAYASVAARTPFRSASQPGALQDREPVSHALSYARGGNTTLFRPDFAPLSSRSRSTGGGSGGANSGGIGGSGGGGGDEGDESRDEPPHSFLWGRLLLLASAAAAAMEQLLERPGRRGRLLAALVLLGALVWQGQNERSRRPGRRTRRRLSESFSFSNTGEANRGANRGSSAGELSDMSSDDEGF